MAAVNAHTAVGQAWPTTRTYEVRTSYRESLDTNTPLLILYPLSQWIETEIALEHVWPLVHHLCRFSGGNGKRFLGDVCLDLSKTLAAGIDRVNAPMSS